jgi:hypothetical protein
MRDQVIIQEFQRINQLLNALAQHVQLSLSGQALFDEAVKNLLMKKGIFTETELKEQIGEEIRKANEAPAPEPVAEAPAEGLIAPSAAEVAKVEETKQV